MLTEILKDYFYPELYREIAEYGSDALGLQNSVRIAEIIGLDVNNPTEYEVLKRILLELLEVIYENYNSEND